MNENSFNVSLDKNPVISIKVIPGHFTTSNTHFSHYLDVGGLKANAKVARDVARELAIPYIASTLVDCIVCVERTAVIGAYLAEELLANGTSVINSGGDIQVVTPYGSSVGKLLFADNIKEFIQGKNVLLLVPSISSGTTLNAALECILYYGGRVAGVSALFVSPSVSTEYKINALFTYDDIPDFKAYRSDQCEMCQTGQKLDAIISSEGYTKI